MDEDIEKIIALLKDTVNPSSFELGRSLMRSQGMTLPNIFNYYNTEFKYRWIDVNNNLTRSLYFSVGNQKFYLVKGRFAILLIGFDSVLHVEITSRKFEIEFVGSKKRLWRTVIELIEKNKKNENTI